MKRSGVHASHLQYLLVFLFITAISGCGGAANTDRDGWDTADPDAGAGSDAGAPRDGAAAVGARDMSASPDSHVGEPSSPMVTNYCVGSTRYKCTGRLEAFDCALVGATCETQVDFPYYGYCRGGPFGPGEMCAEGYKSSARFCFNENIILYCDIDFMRAANCPEGTTCRKAPIGTAAVCAAPDAPTCDPATFVDHCSDDESTRIGCADSGFLWEVACPDGKVCALNGQAPPAWADPVCIKPGQVPCPIGHYGKCIGDLLEACDLNTGYLDVGFCANGTECATGTGGAACLPPGTPTCDETYKTRCLDNQTPVSYTHLERVTPVPHPAEHVRP